MRKLLCAVTVISVLFAACACANTAAPAEPPEITDEELYAVEVEEEQWPIIDGSAAFLPYYTAAAARMLDISEDEASRYVLCSSTDFAYPDLIRGRADVIFAFLPDQEQARLADHEGVTLACYPVLNEAFVFFVSPDNPVDSLSLDQLRDIYTGAVSNWSEVGGSDEPILPFRRSEGSSDHAGLVQFVAAEDELVPSPTEERPGTMEETAEVPANYDGSAGAIGCGYLHAVRVQYEGTDLKLLKIDGTDPSEANVRDRVYPLISQVCAVIRGSEEESPAGQLAQWCAWPLGQALALAKGYVPNMEVDAPEQPPAPADSGESRTDWAEGIPVPKDSGALNFPDPIRILKENFEEDPRLSSCSVTISGLKDKTVENTVNGRIQTAIGRFGDPAFLPDVQGIRAYEAEGLKAENYTYKYINADVTCSAGKMLSVLVTCSVSYEIPAKGDSPAQNLFFSVCEPLNLDLNTGKDIPLTALVSDDAQALPFLNGLTENYLRQNADVVYRDEDDFGTPEGEASESVRVTAFPGLREDQRYYIDKAAGLVYLVLDRNTPWAVTGTGFSCIPLDLTGHAAFTRFRTADDLFE